MFSAARPPVRSLKRSGLETQQAHWGVIFALPAILGFLIFTLGPMLASLVLSFTDYKPISTEINFVGLQNYLTLFKGDDFFFYKSLRVTIYYVILSVPLAIVVSFLMAMVLNKNIVAKGFFRSVFYLPTMVPIVATAMIWTWLLDPDMGLLNETLRMVGLPTSKWIYAENTAVPSFAIINLWTSGGTMIIFLAGLQGVPRTLYEAIDVDGGNAWHKFLHITVPMMTPTIFYNTVMGFIGGFQIFTQTYIMTQGGPNNATLFYCYYIYRTGFNNQYMGLASAIAWVLFVIILVITLLLFKSSNSWVYYAGGED